MTWTWLEIQAELLEDLHAGTGLGMAGCDALIQRDRYDRPMISRTHFEGLLKASSSDLLDSHTVDGLFGRAGGTGQRAVFTSLRMDKSESVKTRLWSATARKGPDNRAPQDETLRVIEYVPAGTVFRGKVFLPGELVDGFRSALKQCTHLGAGRRRGDGLVRFTLENAKPPEGRSLPPRESLCLRLRLRALEPWCLAKTGQPGNIIPTERFLRGRTLQGALIYWLLTWGGGPAAAGAVDWDAVSVGDGLPLPKDLNTGNLSNIEVLPVPLSLLRPKPEVVGGRLPWWTDDAPPPGSRDGFAPNEGLNTYERLKRPTDGECVARSGGGKWHRYSPLLNMHLRNRQGEKPGEPPSLFSMEEIAEDTRFLADILFDEGPVADAFVGAFREILEGRAWLLIGRGKAPSVVEDAAWINRSLFDNSSTPAFRLTLTSDLLLLDEWLCWETHLTAEKLKQLAGVNDDIDVRIAKCFEDTVDVRGFNAASGLPRVPARAIKAGSSYRLDGGGASVVVNSLKGKPALGERTHLGFGRFRLDPDDTPPGLPEDFSEADRYGRGENADKAEGLLKRAKELAEAVPIGGPSRSQWWALRDALRASSGDAQDPLESLGRSQGGRAWDLVKPVIEKLKQCSDREEAALLVDAIIRWIFPKARGGGQ